jgi:phenylacetate-CoA ligase
MASGIARRVYGTAVVLRTLPGQRRAHHQPPERTREVRDARVREAVRYAFETVPFYRDLARSGQVDPREIRTAGDLERLPLIDRELVRRDPARFVSTSGRARDAIPFVTSGTTGVPMRVLHDRRSLLENAAFGEREREVEARFCDKRWRYTAVHVITSGGTGSRVRSIYRRSVIAPMRPNRVSISGFRPVQSVISDINRLRPDVVRAWGSYLEALFRLLEARDISMHMPRLAVYGGDSISEPARRLIEQGFGVPVVSRYTAIESFKIGFTCEEREGFHLHEDLCCVRTVGPEGRTLAPGQPGEVVISNLLNRGTVLLNYRLGDVAALHSEPCRCGRTTVRLSEIDGRVEDIIHRSDGTFVHPRLVWASLMNREEVLGYQLIQHDLERFELRLTTQDDSGFQRIADHVVAELREALGASAVIEANRRDPVQPASGEKFRPVVSLCGPPER